MLLASHCFMRTVNVTKMRYGRRQTAYRSVGKHFALILTDTQIEGDCDEHLLSVVIAAR